MKSYVDPDFELQSVNPISTLSTSGTVPDNDEIGWG